MDVVANALTKIKNAISRKASKVDLMKSGIVMDILNVMKKEGYIFDYKDSADSKFACTVFLKYISEKSAISGLKKISKLSRRVYVSVDSIPRVYNNMGIAIISTSKGVLTDKEARALGVGGEVVCFIW